MDPRPAWSAQFEGDIGKINTKAPFDQIVKNWSWEGSSGTGVRVAVIDSGIDASHPAILSGVAGYVSIIEEPDGKITYDTNPHEDSHGHGTACAGIINSLAPDCELYSIKVLGGGLTGRGTVFAAGLSWAIENGMDVCNLSLGTTKKVFASPLRELADLAYFRDVKLVTAASNLPVPSYPSLFSSVISVASHSRADPFYFLCNPKPPVEYGAYGIDVDVAWLDGSRIRATGNSFAAPHIAGLVTRILGKYPGLTTFQVKTLLRALAANVAKASEG